MVASALRNWGEFTGLRPMNAARDLGGVVDVLEASFANELDSAQWAILRDMRRLRFVAPLLWLLGQVAPELDPFLPGFVWIERGRLVGNVTVTRIRPDSRHWFISNVAVHPNYRRRGIGHNLVSAALDLVERRGGDLVTLEVRHDNDAAQALYRGFGFESVYTTVYLRLTGFEGGTVPSPRGIGLRAVRAHEWPKVYSLAREATPRSVQRIAPVRRDQFERSLDRRLNDWLTGVIQGYRVRRWAVEREGTFVALLTLILRRKHNPSVTLMVHPQWRGHVEESLAAHALRMLSEARWGGLPADVTGAVDAELPGYLPEAIAALEAVGFAGVRSLDCLALELAAGNYRIMSEGGFDGK